MCLVAAFAAAGSARSRASPMVSAQSTANASTLAMDEHGVAATRVVKIANVVVSTTSSRGLTLSISSAKLSKSDGSTPVPFQVALVDHAAAAPSLAAFTTPSGATYTFSTATAGTVQRDLYIRYRLAPLQDPGSYAASINLDATDN